MAFGDKRKEKSFLPRVDAESLQHHVKHGRERHALDDERFKKSERALGQ